MRRLSRLTAVYCDRKCISAMIAELEEHSPIILQNSSNPSSRKNLDVRPYDLTTLRPYDRTTVRPYDRTTVRPYKVLLLTCVVNCTAGTPTLRHCSVVQWSVHSDYPRSSPGRGKALCSWDVREKKMRAPLLGLAKSIY